MPVLGTADEVRDTIRVEIDGGRAHVMAFDVRVREQSHVGEEELAICGGFVAGKQYLGTFIQRKM